MPPERNDRPELNVAPPEPLLPAELRPLEAALASLAPRAGQLDYDRILFLAGQQAASQSRRANWRQGLWPAAFAAVAALAASLLVVLLVREPRVVERVRIVEVRTPARAAPAAETLASDAVLAAPATREPREEPAEAVPSHADPDRLLDRWLEIRDDRFATGKDPLPAPPALSAEDLLPRQAILPQRQWLEAMLRDRPGDSPSEPAALFPSTREEPL